MEYKGLRFNMPKTKVMFCKDGRNTLKDSEENSLVVSVGQIFHSIRYSYSDCCVFLTVVLIVLFCFVLSCFEVYPFRV